MVSLRISRCFNILFFCLYHSGAEGVRAPSLIWILLTVSLNLLNCSSSLFLYWRQWQVRQYSLGLEVNWQKTKVQALGCREDMPLTIKVQGQDVMVVEEFVYLGSLIHSTTGSTCDISQRSAITRAAVQSLENQIWRSWLATSM